MGIKRGIVIITIGVMSINIPMTNTMEYISSNITQGLAASPEIYSATNLWTPVIPSSEENIEPVIISQKIIALTPRDVFVALFRLLTVR